MSLMISGLRWRQCSEAPAVLLYRFMIDATYLYHRDSNSPSVSPYSYVPFQIQQTVSHEDIAFHENAMGPIYQISIVFQPHMEETTIVPSVVYDRLLYYRA